MTTYSNRSNTLRAAKKAGFAKEDVRIIETNEGRFYYEPFASTTAPVEPVSDTPELDAQYDALYGFHKCPGCGTHLDNGVCDFENVMDAQDQDPRSRMTEAKKFEQAYRVQGQEFACFACDYEWGDDASKFDPTRKASTTRRVYNQTGEHAYEPSTPESPVKAVWSLYDSLMAKGEPLVRKVYIAEARGMGMNPNTASAQFNSWKKARGH